MANSRFHRTPDSAERSILLGEIMRKVIDTKQDLSLPMWVERRTRLKAMPTPQLRELAMGVKGTKGWMDTNTLIVGAISRVRDAGPQPRTKVSGQ